MNDILTNKTLSSHEYSCYYFPTNCHIYEMTCKTPHVLHFKQILNGTNTFSIESDVEFSYKKNMTYYGTLYENEFYIFDCDLNTKHELKQFILFHSVPINLYVNASFYIKLAIPLTCHDHFNMFINAFKWSHKTTHFIKVDNCKHKSWQYIPVLPQEIIETKTIYKTNKPHVYLIDKEPVYIKTIQDSKNMETMFKSNHKVTKKCRYNYKFKKWQVIFKQ